MASYRVRSEDGAEVIEHPHATVIVLADGAGATSGGADAADTVLTWVRGFVTPEEQLPLSEPSGWLVDVDLDHARSVALATPSPLWWTDAR